jgi:hypothetical protein
MIFASQPGFRNGICVPFHPFDVISRSMLDLYEVSPTVMDGILSDHKYMDSKPEEGKDVILSMIERVHDLQGRSVLI